MIEYPGGYKLKVEIGDYEIPISAENFKGISIKADMGLFFVVGHMSFIDTLGLIYYAKDVKSGEEIKITIMWERGEKQYKFEITEFQMVRDLISRFNVIEIWFMSLPYDNVMSPKYSRGFGNVVGSSVISDIMKDSGYDNVFTDVSLGSRLWIQPFINNKEMVKLVTRNSVAVASKFNDYVYFSTVNNNFYFKSLKRLFDQDIMAKFSDKISEDTLLMTRIVLTDRRALYLAVGGYGRTMYYFDEDEDDYKYNQNALDRSDLFDGAKYLGMESISVKRETH